MWRSWGRSDMAHLNDMGPGFLPEPQKRRMTACLLACSGFGRRSRSSFFLSGTTAATDDKGTHNVEREKQ